MFSDTFVTHGHYYSILGTYQRLFTLCTSSFCENPQELDAEEYYQGNARGRFQPQVSELHR